MAGQQPRGPGAETFSWEHPLDRERFWLVAQLLYFKNQQQLLRSASPEEELSEGQSRNVTLDDKDASSDGSVKPRQLVSERPLDGLERRFLGRLAESLAREKKIIVHTHRSNHKGENLASGKGKSKSKHSKEDYRLDTQQQLR